MIARIETQFHLPQERTEAKSDVYYRSTETPNGLARDMIHAALKDV